MPPPRCASPGSTKTPAQGQLAIDYGCGSGVLAVAAVKLGAREAYAFDIDPAGADRHARQRRRQRRRRRRCAWSIRTRALPAGADILLANILCGPLCELAPRFAALTRPGGRIVLAGLLERAGRRGDTRARAVV